MQTKNVSYRETVLGLLKMKGAAPKLISSYGKELREEVSELFFVIAEQIVEKEKKNQTTRDKTRRASILK